MPRTTTPSTLVCRLRVPLPEAAWISKFSMAHPDITVEILGHLMSGKGEATVGLSLRGEGAEGMRGPMAAIPGVREVEVVEVRSGSTEYRVVHTTPSLLPNLADLHLMPRFPFLIREGQATWVIAASEDRIRELYARLKAKAPGVVIESLRHTHSQGDLGLLTPRQRTVFDRAMAEGYYEVPRRVTLTELASGLGVAKSTLSESLATIERKILKETADRGNRLT